MFNPFSLFRRTVAWFSSGMSKKAKIIVISFLLIFSLATLYAAYKVNYYFDNDPRACSVCHVHNEANKLWETSSHGDVKCKACHHSTKKDQIKQLYAFVVLGHDKVTPRHGKVIVPWQLCFSCHWEKNEKYPKAPDISRSRFHAKHVFMERIECTKCHGYRTHQFSLEERYCLTCHKGMEVHGTGMEKLACLNCHTDRTADLRPGPKKCLFCHGSEEYRKELIEDGTLDVRHHMPDEKMIKGAAKIRHTESAPMQFNCYECHKPHKSSRPDWGNCLSCHQNILEAGQHQSHIQVMGMKCKQCHKPHTWVVTKEQAKKDCVACHDYKEPKDFLRR